MRPLPVLLLTGLLSLYGLTQARADCPDYRPYPAGYDVPYYCVPAWHYDCATWWHGRWWPAGWYRYYNGCNYLRGYGPCYGWPCPEAYYGR